MIPRVAITISLIALTSGCATFSDVDVVASVEDQEITQGEFDTLLDEFASRGDIFGTSPIGDDRTTGADQARVLLGALVQVAALTELLERSGSGLTGADLAPFYEALPADHPWRALSPTLLDLIASTDSTVIGTALARVTPPTATEVEKTYRSAPVATGLLCVRHILVDTEVEALDLIAQLEAGADFAILASDLSTEPAAAETGGALVSPDSPCITTNQYVTGFDPDFTRGAFTAPAHGWSEPVQSSFGWHVIMNRPWSEVGDAVTDTLTDPSASSLLLDGLLNSSSVRVDPRYGRWDAPTGRIQPIG